MGTGKKQGTAKDAAIAGFRRAWAAIIAQPALLPEPGADLALKRYDAFLPALQDAWLPAQAALETALAPERARLEAAIREQVAAMRDRLR